MPRFTLAALISLVLLSACAKNDTAETVPADQVVATVNGQPIQQSTFDLYVETFAKQSGREVSEEQKAELLDQYIGMRLAAEKAEKDGLAKEPKVRDQLELSRMNVIVEEKK